MSHDDIAAAVRSWAAEHADGTEDQAVGELGLPDSKDTRVIVRGVLARAEWDR